MALLYIQVYFWEMISEGQTMPGAARLDQAGRPADSSHHPLWGGQHYRPLRMVAQQNNILAKQTHLVSAAHLLGYQLTLHPVAGAVGQ